MNQEQRKQSLVEKPEFLNSLRFDSTTFLPGITLRLNPGKLTHIFPDFISTTLHRVTAAVLEGDSTYSFQQWEGVAGQQVQSWTVIGYSEVIIAVEFQNDGSWRSCELRIGLQRNPRGNLVRVVGAKDNGNRYEASVFIETERV